MKMALIMSGAITFMLLLLIPGCDGQAKKEEESFSIELSPGVMSGPAELLSIGQQAKTAQEKLRIFKQIVEAYPESSQADEAQFMVGFILKEDLNRPEAAADAFKVLRENYPDSEWLDDAESLLSESVSE